MRFIGNRSRLTTKLISSSFRCYSSLHVDLQTSLPDKAYVNPMYYEVERKHLLGKSWQLIAHESMLLLNDGKASPATYVAAMVAGWPAIVVRSSKTGDIYAYHNVCRHRAGPLEWNDTSGSCKLHGLKCKYHGWTYSVDGQLKGVPGFNAIRYDESSQVTVDLDKQRYHLWPMRVANWRGLIFVQPYPEGTTSMNGVDALELFISENKRFCDRINGLNRYDAYAEGRRGESGDDVVNELKMPSSSIPLEEFSYYSSSIHRLNCNWKVCELVPWCMLLLHHVTLRR